MSIKSKHQYQSIIELMNEGVLVQAPDGVIIACNRSAEDILGLSCGQIMKECPLDAGWQAIHEDGSPFSGKSPLGMFSLNAGQSKRNMIMGVQKSAGRVTWISINVNSIFEDKKGCLSAIVVTFSDISGRKNAEDLLREKESNFRSLIESAHDLIVVASAEGKLLFANKAVSKKLRYTSDELLSMRILDMHPQNKRAEAKEIITAMLRGERDACLLPLVTKTGVLVPVETRIWAGRWDGEDCIFGLSKDLTSEQEASQRFERLFRNNPALMALSALPERRFYDVNDAFLRTLGYAREEVIGRTHNELGLFVDMGRQEKAAKPLKARGSVSGEAFQVRCKNGVILEGLFSGEIISSQGCEYFLTVMIDITERNQAHKALRASKQLHQATFERSQAVKLIVDPADGTILDANSAAADFYGYSRTRLKQLNIKDINILLASQIQLEMLLAVQEQRKHFNFRHRLANGEIRDVEVYSSPIRIDGRDVLYSIIHDISDRKKAEEEVRRQSGLILSLLDNIPDIIFFKTVTGVYLGCNQQFANLVGLSTEEIVGMTDYDLFKKEVADSFREYDRQMLTSCQSQCNEEWILYPDGRKVLVDTLKTPYRGPDKQLIGILGISRNITDRKMFENAVKEHRNNLMTILDNLPFLAWLKDKEGVFLAVNEPFAVSCGLSGAADLLGKTDMDIWPKHLAGAYRKDDLEVMASGRKKRVEEIVRDKGADKWFETYKSPLTGADGVVSGTAGFAYDITERKLAEEETYRLNQELEFRVKQGMEELVHVSRVAVLGQIAAALAHELNQPLGAILNWVSSAEMALDRPVPDVKVVRDSLLRIVEADKRAASVISKIRGLVKKAVHPSERVDVEDLIRQVVTIVRNDGILKGAVIDINSTDVSKVVFGDKIQLQQVLLNLIVNALESCAYETDKRVLIRTGVNRSGKVTVSVSDSGLGIDANDIDSLFQPFYTTKREGLGIGLFICRSIIQSHGGELTARNNSDRGATFEFLLPSADQTKEAG